MAFVYIPCVLFYLKESRYTKTALLRMSCYPRNLIYDEGRGGFSKIGKPRFLFIKFLN